MTTYASRRTGLAEIVCVATWHSKLFSYECGLIFNTSNAPNLSDPPIKFQTGRSFLTTQLVKRWC